MRRDWPLVGRTEELELVRAAVAAGSRAVVLAGAAGVGKTRLARELVAHAFGEDATVVWAVATGSSATLPFGALANVVHAAPAGAAPTDLLREAARAIAALNAPGRVVLAVDDAHLLDDASATFVLNAAADGLAFVLVTVRSGEPAPEAVTALWKDGLAERVEVQALSRQEVRTLIERVVEGRIDEGTLERLFRASRGNVLYLRELVVGGMTSGAFAERTRVWTWEGPLVAPRLTELIESRLQHLDAHAREVLERLAIGEPLGLALTGDQATVAALEAEGLVAVSSDAGVVVARLAHPLYAEVLRAGMPVLRAAVVKRALADGLEAGELGHADMLRVAVWRLDAGGDVRPELLLRAASHATSMYEHELAERLARKGIEQGGGFAAALSLGNSLNWQARYDEAEAVFAELEPDATDHEATTRLAVRRSTSLFWGSGGSDAALSLIERTEPVVDDDHRDQLAAHRATLLLFAGHTQDAVRLGSTVLERTHSPSAAVEALAAVSPGLAVAGRATETIELVDRHSDLVLRSADSLASPVGWIMAARILASWLSGSLADAMSFAQGLHSLSLSNPALGIRGGATLALGRITLQTGRAKAAAGWLREGVAAFRTYDLGGLRPWCLAALAHALALTGDVDEARALVAEAQTARSAGRALFEADILLARAWVEGGADVRGAAHVAEHAADVARDRGQHAFEALALHDAARLGRPAEVAARLSAVASRVDGAFAPAMAAHVHALASRDAAALENAGVTFTEIGTLLLAAESWAEASGIHRESGRGASARSCATRAAALAEACGGLLIRALDRAVQPALTSREREIARLAAGGLSNKQIASRLVVSVRTVDNHLHQIYAKLGVSGRGELASVLAPQN